MPERLKELLIYTTPILAVGALFYNVITTRAVVKNELCHLKEAVENLGIRVAAIERWIMNKGKV